MKYVKERLKNVWYYTITPFQSVSKGSLIRTHHIEKISLIWSKSGSRTSNEKNFCRLSATIIQKSNIANFCVLRGIGLQKPCQKPEERNDEIRMSHDSYKRKRPRRISASVNPERLRCVIKIPPQTRLQTHHNETFKKMKECEFLPLWIPEVALRYKNSAQNPPPTAS